MAVRTITGAQVLLGSFDASGFTGQVAIDPVSAAVADVSRMTSGGFYEYAVGIRNSMLKVDGFADHASGGISTTFTVASLGTQMAAAVAPLGGATAGDSVDFLRGVLRHFTPLKGEVGGAAQIQFELAADAAEVHGYVGAPLLSRNSTLTGTAVAMTGPTAAQYLYGALFVTAAAGTDLAVKIQSDDNSGFTSATDRITFSTVSAIGSQWGARVAGNLSSETHFRVVATIGSGSFTFAAVFGVEA